MKLKALEAPRRNEVLIAIYGMDPYRQTSANEVAPSAANG